MKASVTSSIPRGAALRRQTAGALRRVGRAVPGPAGGFLQQLGRYAGTDRGFALSELGDGLGALAPAELGGGVAALTEQNARFIEQVRSSSYAAFADEVQRCALFHAFRGLERSAYAGRRLDFRLVVDLYSAFRRVSVARVLWDIDKVQDEARALRLWRQLTADESDLSDRSLSRYYNSIPFPGTCGLLRLWNAPWLVSRVYPLLIARAAAAAPSFFDYGGSTGLLTSLARSMGYGPVALIDDYDAGLRFAEWRDAALGRTGIDYVRSSAVTEYAASHQFDVGSCHQVLEHLRDLSPCLEHLSRLVKPGGLLFLSTGFALYPHAGHLRDNVRYHGHEAELLAPFGFSPVALDLAPLQLERFLHVFQKN